MSGQSHASVELQLVAAAVQGKENLHGGLGQGGLGVHPLANDDAGALGRGPIPSHEAVPKEELPMRLPGKSRHAMGVRQQRLQILLWRTEEGLHLGHRAIVISSPLGRRQGLQLGQTGAGIG